ncbi:hypothetical protein T08_16570 [Trichinella sp. T8]|nr:hypothetical protein T08_16570 [Trichinella sp. T8]
MVRSLHKAEVLQVVLNPDTIICDYETVMITANQGYFLNMRVQDCYVHFSQVPIRVLACSKPAPRVAHQLHFNALGRSR